MSKKGFSFVEIIIVVTITALLAVIGVSINSNFQQSAMNSKIVADLETLKGSFSLYKSENNSLPLPLGNVNFYGTGTEYMHSQTGAFGVYGSIRENILPKKYIDILPVDPRNNQYYAYGKVFSSNEFEIAGVISQNGEYESIVVGDYRGKDGPKDLIREYNGTNFVFNKSRDIFPYNPEKKAMNAKILSASGSVSINGQIVSGTTLLSTILVSGDSVGVDAGGNVQIGFSDGSISTLGDTNSPSEIVLAYLDYKGNSFFTKIQIALKIGTLWTQATKLDSDSEFEVYTTDTTASVRGTVFGVSKNISGNSLITVDIGKVTVGRLSIPSGGNTFDTLVQKISIGQVLPLLPLNVPGVTKSTQENGQNVNYIEVKEGEVPVGVKVSKTSATSELVSESLQDTALGNGISLKLVRTDRYDGHLQFVSLKNDSRFRGTDKIIINNQPFADAFTDVKQALQQDRPNNVNLKIRSQGGISTGNMKSFSVKVCRTENLCTQTLIIPTQLPKEENTSKKDILENTSCPGINIGGYCVQNELSASGYTLVGAADYTKKDSALYIYNGAKINGGYTGTGLTSDGYFPTVNGEIAYNLGDIIGSDEYIIDLDISGDFLNDSSSNQKIFYKNGDNYISYQALSGNGRKFVVRNGSGSYYFYSTTGWIDPSNTFRIRFKEVNNTLQISLKGGDFSFEDQKTTSIRNTLKEFLLGEQNGLTEKFKGKVLGLKVYKKVKTPIIKDVSNTNAISLKKSQQQAQTEEDDEEKNGVCGNAHGKVFSSLSQIGTLDLCAIDGGTPNNMSEGGTSYTWICKGQHGGTDTSCSATRTTTVSGYGCSSCPLGQRYSNGESCSGVSFDSEIQRCTYVDGPVICRKRSGPGCISGGDKNWVGTLKASLPSRSVNIQNEMQAVNLN